MTPKVLVTRIHSHARSDRAPPCSCLHNSTLNTCSQPFLADTLSPPLPLADCPPPSLPWLLRNATHAVLGTGSQDTAHIDLRPLPPRLHSNMLLMAPAACSLQVLRPSLPPVQASYATLTSFSPAAKRRLLLAVAARCSLQPLAAYLLG